MRRRIFSLILIIMVLSSTLFLFSGCGENEERDNDYNVTEDKKISETQNENNDVGNNSTSVTQNQLNSGAEVIKNFYNAYFNNPDKTKFLDYMDLEIMGFSGDEKSEADLKTIKEELQNRKDNNSPEVEIEPIKVNSQEEFNELYKKYYNVDANEQNLETPYAIWKKQLGDDCEIYFAIIKNAGENELPDICAVKNGKIAHTLAMEFWFSGAIYKANKSN